MKDNSKADVSHTDEFDKMFQEMVKQVEDEYKVKSEHPETEEEVGLIDGFSSRWINEFNLPDGYIFKDENGNVINAKKIVLEKKKKEYPKTYEECCKVLGVNSENFLSIRNIHRYDGEEETIKYERDLLDKFDSLWQLIICRDAYWKLYGEKMGLGKPWEPDWNNVSDKYCIYFVSGDVWSKECQTRQCPFAFPTPEMRDAFKKNFDPDIEICKELL